MDLQKVKSVEEDLYKQKEQVSFKLDFTKHTKKAERESKKRGTFYGFGAEDTKEVTSTKEAVKTKSKPGKMTRALRKIGLSKAPAEEQQEQNRELSPEEELRNQQELDEKIDKINALSEEQGDVTKVVGFSDVYGVHAPLRKLNPLTSNPFYHKMKEQGDLDNQSYSPEAKAAFLSYKEEADVSKKKFDYHQMNTLLRNDALEENKKTKTTLNDIHDDIFAKNTGAYELAKRRLTKLNPEFKFLSPEQQKKELYKLQEQYVKEYYQQSSTSKDVVDATQAAIKEISKHKLKEDMTLFRHVASDCLGVILGLPWGTPAEEVDEKIKEFNKGKTIVHDKAFLSTSMFRDGADNFKRPGGIEVRILAHKGTQAVNIARLTDEKGKITDMQNDEQEMLLQAGTQMRILRVEKPEGGEDPKKQSYIIYMETVPELAPLAGKKKKK